ncbi:HNH endonuclease [Sutcliffiella sp. NPDC057660]|uniref:HNH endonuclease n=1 Tax=Sutcliffiella sp. NPDC057660 TaxID=3346199 RepID=UPI0036960BE1
MCYLNEDDFFDYNDLQMREDEDIYDDHREEIEEITRIYFERQYNDFPARLTEISNKRSCNNKASKSKITFLGIIDDSLGAAPIAKNNVKVKSESYYRDQQKSNKLKALYNHTCQICSKKGIEIKPGEYFTETHHLRPMGEQGPDFEGNMVVACQNCHKYLDNGSIYINPDTREITHFKDEIQGCILNLKHDIYLSFLSYQNSKYIYHK